MSITLNNRILEFINNIKQEIPYTIVLKHEDELKNKQNLYYGEVSKEETLKIIRVIKDTFLLEKLEEGYSNKEEYRGKYIEVGLI